MVSDILIEMHLAKPITDANEREYLEIEKSFNVSVRTIFTLTLFQC